MAPAESTKKEGSCCHRSVVQFVEIKNELKNIRQTVDLAVKLLSVSSCNLLRKLV